MNDVSTPFDDVYKTLLEKFPQLVIPVVNEQFGTKYKQDETVINLRQEYHKEEGYVAADSVIKICDKIYHVECQSNPDGTIGVRMLEYDFYIGIRESKKNDHGIYQVKMPRSCVLYLRHNKMTGDEIPVEVILNDESKYIYKVPIVKVQKYSLREMFEKKLFLFLPFYAVRYEELKDKKNRSPKELELMLSEYQELIERIDETFEESEEGRWVAFELCKSIQKIAEYLFQGEENEEIREKIGGITMGGTVMKTGKEEFEEMCQQLQEKNELLQEQNAKLQSNQEQMRKCVKALRIQGYTDQQIETEFGISLKELE